MGFYDLSIAFPRILFLRAVSSELVTFDNTQKLTT